MVLIFVEFSLMPALTTLCKILEPPPLFLSIFLTRSDFESGREHQLSRLSESLSEFLFGHWLLFTQSERHVLKKLKKKIHQSFG